MILLDAALKYAAIGWHVFPISPTTKVPLTEHGHRDATTDEATIQSWWTASPDARIGVWLRKSGLMCVDVDVADDKDGAAQLEALERELGPLPRTNVQASGRGGTHIVLKDPSGRPDDLDGYLKGRAAPAVDIKHNGYIVVEPSGAYRWTALDPGNLADLPEAWLARLLKPVAAEVNAEGVEVWASSTGPLDEGDLEELATYLAGLKRGQGKGATYAAVVRIFHDLGQSITDGADYLLAWNQASGKPYSDAELARQVTRIAGHDFPTTRGHMRGVKALRTALLADAPPAPPMPRTELKAHLKTDQAKLGRAPRASDKREALELGKIINGKRLAEDGEDPEQALAYAATVLVKHAPPEAGVDALAGMLAHSAAATGGMTVEQALEALGAAKALVEPVDALAARARTDAPRVRGAEFADDEAVRAALIAGQDGPRACGSNLELILRHSEATRGHLRYNEIRNAVEVVGGEFAGEHPNGLDVAIKNWLERAWGLFASIGDVGAQLLYVARKYASFNPVAEYLEGLTWDGVERIDTWLTVYAGAEDVYYNRRVGSMWLISAVARALEPGCKVDTVLVLEGDQGLKKSTAFDILGGVYFTDTPLDIHNKDSRALAAQKWIVELAELASLRGREAESIKAFLSARNDTFRPPYGRVNEDFARRCVFAGTTNLNEYLNDPTGARRFWSVLVQAVDAPALRRDRDQLWAEATTRARVALEELAAGRTPDDRHRWWFEREEQIEHADGVAAERRAENVWASLLLGWLANQPQEAQAKGYTLADLAGSALQIAKADLKRHEIALGDALRAAGFQRVRRRNRSNPVRLWVPPGHTE